MQLWPSLTTTEPLMTRILVMGAIDKYGKCISANMDMAHARRQRTENNTHEPFKSTCAKELARFIAKTPSKFRNYTLQGVDAA